MSADTMPGDRPQRVRSSRRLAQMTALVGAVAGFGVSAAARKVREEREARRLARRGSEATQADRIVAAQAKRDRRAVSRQGASR